MNGAKFIATCFGIGYIQKGAGTVAALFCCVAGWLLNWDAASGWLQLLFIFFIFFAGVPASGKVEKDWGPDSSRVVVDEVLGMFIALFLVPRSWPYYLLAFVLFRAFDMAKPFGIRKLEALPSGWGVMMDDLVAGLYTSLLLHLLLMLKIFPSV